MQPLCSNSIFILYYHYTYPYHLYCNKGILKKKFSCPYTWRILNIGQPQTMKKKIRTQILSSGKSQFQINFSFKEFFVNFYFYFELDSRKILYEVSGGFLPFQSQWKCSYEKRIALFTCNLSFDLSTNCLGPLFQKRAYWTKNWENSPKTIFEKNLHSVGHGPLETAPFENNLKNLI